MSVAIVVDGVCSARITAGGQVVTSDGVATWRGDTLEIGSSGGSGSGIFIKNNAPGGVAGDSFVGSVIGSGIRVGNFSVCRSVSVSDSGDVAIGAGNADIRLFSGKRVEFGDGHVVTCPRGSSMNIVNGDVYIDGKLVGAEKRARTEAPAAPAAPVVIANTKTIGSIRLNGSSSLTIERGAVRLSPTLAIEQNGASRLQLDADGADSVVVETNGSSKCSMAGIPSKSIRVEANGASKVTIGNCS